MTQKQCNIPISIKGIVFDNEKVWLRKNERNEWELPGGKIDPGEQPTDTVIRELNEELGFTVNVENIISSDIYTIQKSSNETCDVLVITYLCKLLFKSGIFEEIGEAGRAEFKSFSIQEVELLNMPNFYKESIIKSLNVINTKI